MSAEHDAPGARRLASRSVVYRVARRGASTAVTVAVIGTGSPLLDPLLVAGVAVVGLVCLGGFEVARWSRYRYEVTDDTLDIRSGVVRRRTREIPLERVQNVDVSRSAVQRVLGIAAVDIETAGGGRTEATLRYVSPADADRLRDALARRTRPDETAASGSVVFELSPRELLLAAALSFDRRLPAPLAFVGSGLVTSASLPAVAPAGLDGLPTVALGGLLVAAVALLGLVWGASAAATVLQHHGLRLRRVDDELRYERGLVRRREGVVPLDKVQTVTVVDTPLRRALGYAALHVETAGHTPGDDGGGVTVPLATAGRAADLCETLVGARPGAVERPPRRVRRRYAARYLAVLGALLAVGVAAERLLLPGLRWELVLALLPAVPVAAHLVRQHRGWRLAPDHFVARDGVLRRRTSVVPYDRVQTVLDARTAFQRRLRLATVTADTAGSRSLAGADAAAVDVDAATADRIRAALLDRLVRALGGDGDTRGTRRPVDDTDREA